MDGIKRAQTWSIEAYIAIGVFLVAVVLFYLFITISNSSNSLDDEAKKVSALVDKLDVFSDGALSDQELVDLSAMNCSDLKDYFETNKNICIYLRDKDGKIVKLPTVNGSMVSAIGCEGLEIGGEDCYSQ